MRRQWIHSIGGSWEHSFWPKEKLRYVCENGRGCVKENAPDLYDRLSLTSGSLDVRS